MKIRYYSDGRWDGGGVLPGHLQDFSDLSDWIRAFLAEVKDLRKRYLESLQDDGRLLGQEKADIVIEMDEIIAGLLLFRRYISEEGSDAFSGGSEADFVYNVTVYDKTWLGNGRIGISGTARKAVFVDLHNDIIIDKIKGIFLLYGEICSDRIINNTERRMMFEKIDGVLHDFLRIECTLLFSDITT